MRKEFSIFFKSPMVSLFLLVLILFAEMQVIISLWFISSHNLMVTLFGVIVLVVGLFMMVYINISSKFVGPKSDAEMSRNFIIGASALICIFTLITFINLAVLAVISYILIGICMFSEVIAITKHLELLDFGGVQERNENFTNR